MSDIVGIFRVRATNSNRVCLNCHIHGIVNREIDEFTDTEIWIVRAWHGLRPLSETECKVAVVIDFSSAL